MDVYEERDRLKAELAQRRRMETRASRKRVVLRPFDKRAALRENGYELPPRPYVPPYPWGR